MNVLRCPNGPMRLSSLGMLVNQKASSRAVFSPYSHRILARTPDNLVSKRIFASIRLYSTANSKNGAKKPPQADQVKQKAKLAAGRQTGNALPERLLIYHAGTGRVTFLAMFKVTSIFIGAFFCFAVVPGYASEGRLDLEPIGLALCGIIPMVLIGFTTSPFVTHIHMHLPTAARASRQSLERFVQTLPSTTPLTLTTMNIIGKPRYSNLQAGHLQPERSRLGLVNYVRDHVDEEAASRRWYNMRAVNKFYIQEDAALKTAKKTSRGKKSPVEWWIWDAVRERISKRAATTKSAASHKA